MADTENITPSDRRPTADRLQIILAGGLSLALIGLALPMVVGEIAVADARSVVAASLENRPDHKTELTQEDYVQASASIRAMGAWTRDAHLVSNLGLLLQRQAETNPGASAVMLKTAMTATEAGLARNPAMTSAWTRLAYQRTMVGDRPGAAAALQLSILCSAMATQIMPSRLRLGLFLLDDMNAEQRDLLARQVRLMWVARPDELANIARDENAQAFVTSALESLSEAEMSQFARHSQTNSQKN